MVTAPTFREMLDTRAVDLERLAREVGAGLSTIYRWREGESMPQRRHLQRLARALELTPRTVLAALRASRTEFLNVQRKQGRNRKP